MSDKIKKLSDAIRLGAMFRPQCTMRLFSTVGSCSLGAAAEAIGLRKFETPDGGMSNEGWVQFYSRFGIKQGSKLIDEIVGRNDKGGWTREQIADWLEAQGL